MEEIKYDPRVLIGNWQEELLTMKERERLYELKKEKGELKAQKARRFFDYMSKEVAITLPDEYVRYGGVFQLLAPNVSNTPGGEGKNCCLALSCVPTEEELESERYFVEGCSISASPHLEACPRNTFIICSTGDGEKDGQPVLYGESFHLRPAATRDGEELLVQSKFGLLSNKLGRSGEPSLQLSSVKNVDTKWHCVFIDPNYRFETNGSPVLPNQKLIICHSSSNRRLAVEDQFWNKNLFGLESEVSVHTMLDPRRLEKGNNIWMIATQKHGENKVTIEPADTKC
ncbi:cilia- and flagella-associated protein 161-like isoform X2 [Ischnura elegans]|uniref:cilia- and flagella-associated protein 161-like isoform X2 n=1 Tax=Ischnura elegans TaxID=197161 RepID=UPI001ED89867|nr:cilia- and flagella-associated protein 161-like isoform X2 [Ischnura elegans]